jgi:hypothetical protein
VRVTEESFWAPFYRSLHKSSQNLLNVLVQIANETELYKNVALLLFSRALGMGNQCYLQLPRVKLEFYSWWCEWNIAHKLSQLQFILHPDCSYRRTRVIWKCTQLACDNSNSLSLVLKQTVYHSTRCKVFLPLIGFAVLTVASFATCRNKTNLKWSCFLMSAVSHCWNWIPHPHHRLVASDISRAEASVHTR